MTAQTADQDTPTYDGQATLRETDRGVYKVVLGVPDASEPRDRGNGLVSYTLSFGGEKHVNAYLGSIVSQIGRPDETVLKEAAAEHRQMTLLLANRSVARLQGVDSGDDRSVMSGYAPTTVEVREVRLFESARGLGMLPKGARTKGFLLPTERVLAVYDGWGEKQREEALGLFQACADNVPVLRQLTREDLAACYDPREAAEPGDPDYDPDYDAYDLANTKAVVHFTHPGFDFGNGPVPGCEFHITYSIPNEEDPDYSIYGGWFYAPEGSYLESEHGSFYEKDLLRFDSGLVIAPRPGPQRNPGRLWKLTPTELHKEQQEVNALYLGKRVEDPISRGSLGEVVAVEANPYGGNPRLTVHWDNGTVDQRALHTVLSLSADPEPTNAQPTIDFGPEL